MHIDFEDIQQDVPRLGSKAVAFQQVRRPDHDELQTSTRIANMRGSFTVSPVWSLDLTIPFVHRRHSHITVCGHHGDGVPEDEHVDGADTGTLQFDLIEGMSLYGYYQLPLYQRVNDVQITSDRNLLIGLGYSLHWP